MSPLERWNTLASPDRVFLPLEPDELEIVCCDVVERTIAHDGIHWATVKFQSPALQKLGRNLPAELHGRVMVHHCGHLARIWVRDPADGSFLEVLNHDPATKDLTVKQGRDLELARGKQDSGSRVSAAEGREQLRGLSRQLVESKSPKAKRMLMNLLNLLPFESELENEPLASKPRKVKKNPDAVATVAQLPTAANASPLTGPSISDKDDVPIFATRPSYRSTRHQGGST